MNRHNLCHINLLNDIDLECLEKVLMEGNKILSIRSSLFENVKRQTGRAPPNNPSNITNDSRDQICSPVRGFHIIIYRRCLIRQFIIHVVPHYSEIGLSDNEKGFNIFQAKRSKSRRYFTWKQSIPSTTRRSFSFNRFCYESTITRTGLSHRQLPDLVLLKMIRTNLTCNAV